MIQQIKESAESVGINAFITNSKEGIETQLNRLTREEDGPILLVTWDIDVSITFDINGFLQNPSANIVALLVIKPEDTTKVEAEKSADDMAALFNSFIQDLYKRLIPFMVSTTIPIINAGYKHVPKYGTGKHSGIFARWTMFNPITVSVCK